MRLNVMNPATLVSAALARAGVSNVNPRFGLIRRVNPNVFKYTSGEDALLVERVDLSTLFGKIPQDISGITFDLSQTGGESLLSKVNVDALVEEPPVLLSVAAEKGPAGSLETFFNQWKRLVGLNVLETQEVDLSESDGYMTIDATNALMFKGSVKVKIK